MGVSRWQGDTRRHPSNTQSYPDLLKQCKLQTSWASLRTGQSSEKRAVRTASGVRNAQMPKWECMQQRLCNANTLFDRTLHYAKKVYSGSKSTWSGNNVLELPPDSQTCTEVKSECISNSALKFLKTNEMQLKKNTLICIRESQYHLNSEFYGTNSLKIWTHVNSATFKTLRMLQNW